MKVKLRNEIEDQFKWNLEDIYKDENAFELDFKKVQEYADNIAQFKGCLFENKEGILKCLKYCDECGDIFDKLFVYAHMKQDEDVTCDASAKTISRLSSLITKYSADAAYIDVELAKNSKEFLLELSSDKDFEDYSYYLKCFAKKVQYMLSEKEEVLLSKATRFTGLFKEGFKMLDNADIQFDSFKNDKGEKVELSHGIYGYYMQTGSRKERKKAFDSMFNAYRKNINLITSLYKGNVQKNVFFSQVKGYKNCLERATISEDVPSEVYYKLIENIHVNLKYLHQYMKYRKKQLGYKQLHMYDLHIPTVQDVDKTILYSEAQQMVKKALKPLGKDYANLLDEAFSNGWIDVYENKNKRSGAYSTGAYSTHPYVLLNYRPVLNDVFTIAHELGHAMHTYYSNKNQPYAKANYEIFVAEVASTVNEFLLVQHLLKDAQGEYRKYLLTYLLNMFRTTIFRQAQFAEFELKAHEMAQEDKPITPNELCDLYYELNKKYYGKYVVNDDLIRYEWARIPHFYTAFYVYKYSTGLISAVCIAQDILKNENNFVEKYKQFLSAGGSMSPIDILKIVDVDLTKDAPYKKAMDFYKQTLKEIEKI